MVIARVAVPLLELVTAGAGDPAACAAEIGAWAWAAVTGGLAEGLLALGAEAAAFSPVTLQKRVNKSKPR